MFCSNCGKELGAVAHIRNDQLLCEDCFLKLGQGEQANHTIVIGEPAEEERKNATSIAAPAPPPPAPPAPRAASPPAPTQAPPQANPQAEFSPSQEGTLLSDFLMRGESILWKRSFSKGIVHRHLTFTEVVTNIMAMCIDDEKLKLIGYVPLRLAEVNVDKEQRIYEGAHSGVSSHGMYAGRSAGQSAMYGNVNFFANGKIILTFYNVRDPQGLKSLVNASKKSSGFPRASPQS